ncbi:MAG: FxsA family protein, partial [Spirochaetia bacterium]
LNTVLIVVGTGILGAWLARSQGFTVWLRIQREMNMGVFPADDMLDGLLIFFAGAVLITPGVMTDVLGFIFLIPLTRAKIRQWVKRRLQRMNERGSVTFRDFIR